jgi:hypothetical protein
VIHPNESYTIALDFADGPGSYTGKIKYLSSDPNLFSISSEGVITTGPNYNASATIAIILENGSILSGIMTVVQTINVPYGGYALKSVLETSTIVSEGFMRRISVTLIGLDNSVNVWNLKKLTYEMNDAGGTGSTVTPGGWFHAGTTGTAIVTATAENEDGNLFTGTVTVTVLGTPTSEEQPYVSVSTNWTALDPAPAYAGGDGTEANPYLISSVRQFKKLAADIELLGSVDATYQKYFELTTDLDFSDDNTVTSSLIGYFYGTFDGGGHVIKNLEIDATGKSAASIFNSLSYGEIKNLGREGGRIFDTGTTSSAVAAGIVHTITNGKLSNCYNSSSIENTYRGGGLVYSLNNGSIENCYNTGNITVNVRSGGLVGSVLGGGGTVYINNCYNLGDVTLSGNSVGALVGITNNPAGNKQILNMNDCFNFGNMTMGSSGNDIGSVVGAFDSSLYIEMNAINVYSRPDVASANNGAIPKSNQPIGWWAAGSDLLINMVLPNNPTLKEDPKYSLDYSRSAAFAAELGGAFEAADGRSPKLTWEK